MIGIVEVQDVEGSCVRDTDWPTPCFDQGILPDEKEFREIWHGYYEHKGSAFMELKKTEMFQAVENEKFKEWVYDETNPFVHYNIYSYYLSIGEITNQFSGKSVGYMGIVGVQESFAEESELIASPRHQLESGIAPENIQCREDRVLVLRTNGNPLCVKPQTAEKLIQRGWAIDVKVNVKIYTDKSEYKQGEEINITMKNEGKEDVFFNFKVGFSISDESGNTVKSFGPGNFYLDLPTYDVTFTPLDIYNATWSQKDSRFKDAYVSPGTYTIKTNFIDVQKNPHTASTQFDIIIPEEYYALKGDTDPEFLSYFDDAEYVFVGKLTSKIASDVVPEFFWLNFDVDEYLKYFPASGKPSDLPLNLNITTHEGAWQNCILTEGKTYLIFAVDEYDLRYTRDQHCFWAVEIPHYAVEELREISTVLYNFEQLNQGIKDTELKNKSEIINGCKSVEGDWLDEHNECESGGITEAFENYCSDFDGTYYSCHSGCRHSPDWPDVVCIAQCFAVCEFDYFIS